MDDRVVSGGPQLILKHFVDVRVGIGSLRYSAKERGSGIRVCGRNCQHRVEFLAGDEVADSGPLQNIDGSLSGQAGGEAAPLPYRVLEIGRLSPMAGVDRQPRQSGGESGDGGIESTALAERNPGQRLNRRSRFSMCPQ